MRRSTLRKKLSGTDAAIQRRDGYRADAANGRCADDSSAVCSCSDSSLNDDEDNNVGKEEFRKLGFTVYDVPGELTERRPASEKTETTAGRKRDGGGRSYYGALISGAAFGAVSMGVLMVRFSGCFHPVQYLGAFTPT
nr:hypothetical protein A4A49_12933 [Ipomoea batatas]GME12832.1 hypothetical protein A4A49_12933 [Ipomoea batatas]